jgi:hypothetical protein
MANPGDNGDPTKGRHRDLFAALTSGFVGALALATSLYNVYLQRQQLRAAVWPRLEIRQENSEDDYKLFIANRGVGPAQIQRIRMSVNGEQLPSLKAVMEHLPGPEGPEWIGGLALTTLSPGGDVLVFELNWAGALRLMQKDKILTVEFCFCSTLDECWHTALPFKPSTPETTLPTPDCRPDSPPFRMSTDEEIQQRVVLVRRAIQARMDGGLDARAEGGPAGP